MSYGRFWWRKPEVYCARCQLAFGAQERNVVQDGTEAYHSNCYDIKKKQETASEPDEPSDITAFIGLAVVVVGFLFF